MEGTEITSLILQIVLIVLGMVATVVGAWVGKGQRELQESKKVRDWSEGIKNFNPVIWDLLWAAGGTAVERVQDEADELAYGDAYDGIKREALEFLSRYAQLTGVKADNLLTEENLDKMIQYVLKESTESYKKTVKELESPALSEPVRLVPGETLTPPKVDLTDDSVARIQVELGARMAEDIRRARRSRTGGES